MMEKEGTAATSLKEGTAVNHLHETNNQHSKNSLKLINMNDIAVEEVRWLWYPYIPFGKITVIQGDPGNGNYESK